MPVFEDVAVDLKRTVDPSTLLGDALKARRRGQWRVYYPKPILVPADGTLVVVAERFDADDRFAIGQVTVHHVDFGLAGWQGWVRGVALVPSDPQMADANGQTWEEFIEIGKALVDQALGPEE